MAWGEDRRGEQETAENGHAHMPMADSAASCRDAGKRRRLQLAAAQNLNLAGLRGDSRPTACRGGAVGIRLL